MLQLSSSSRERLEKWVRAGYPHETCGILVGRVQDGRVQVERVLQARNLNAERARDRYELDPAALVQADLEARAAELEVVGFWHSHPDHPARPSETDRQQAWEGYSYVIASVGPEGVGDITSWRLEGAQFEREDIQS